MPAPSQHTQFSAPSPPPPRALRQETRPSVGSLGHSSPSPPPALPAGERARSPHRHSAVGGWRDKAAAHWGSPVGEEDARFHGSGLLLRPRCPRQPFDFLWGQGTECLQPRVGFRPSAAHRYIARYYRGFSFTGIMQRTRLFMRSVMR